MANFEVFYNQVLIGTFAAGIAFALFVWLVYRAIWRPRQMEATEGSVEITNFRTFVQWLVGTIPWAVIAAIIGSLTYTAIHIYHAMKNPPNI